MGLPGLEILAHRCFTETAMKNWWWGVIVGILGGLLGAGLIFLTTRAPRGAPISLLPAPTPAPVIVQVAGAVAKPGVYSLPPGSRLQDAVTAAGGLAASADPDSVNLAARLQDGEKIDIPVRPAPSPTLRPGEIPQRLNPLSPTPEEPPTPSSDHPVNINTATQAELESLPGIGPITAQKILEYRSSHGPFSRAEAIQNVPGIGPKTYERLKDLITTGT